MPRKLVTVVVCAAASPFPGRGSWLLWQCVQQPAYSHAKEAGHCSSVCHVQPISMPKKLVTVAVCAAASPRDFRLFYLLLAGPKRREPAMLPISIYMYCIAEHNITLTHMD
ncbi:Hypothetical predicted protein [Pelobates cultripes]|uniref:Uncharacterized protein n=1 Tax=Pelobates cultripes TaxID=61616 RepID=A0AAD1RIK3_PELCU|nr:Hypothetical predicted protein [Pelobates cultripes]